MRTDAHHGRGIKKYISWGYLPQNAVDHNQAAYYPTGDQPRFSDKGDNRWAAATRDSLCWPYAVAATGDTLVVADSGNNRVLLWRAAA